MERIESPIAAAERCRTVRDTSPSTRIGFVPTMGALHEGHLALVRRAAAENDLVVVSIFVNPLQFDDARDLAAYHRDFDGDCALLEGAGAHIAFTGGLDEFFPEYDLYGPSGTDVIEAVDPGPAARAGLEGDVRPGHFEGVATIVRRLFDLVRPHVAYFGAKDWQQTLVVRHVAGSGEPSIVVVPTDREASGLARSSRNARLSPAQREHAAVVHRALLAAREAFAGGERDPVALEGRMRAVLDREDGTEIEYAALRDARTLATFDGPVPDDGARALVAVRLAGVRLIDNLGLVPDEESE
ncbi:pantoate--beta-alanine ligase [Rohdeia mirabilis]|uniref:pantoate--beta-alanine ligase n=1 Tax=Rohdeia mirabilis TaxID=2528008 RepID=UPI003AF3FB9D